MHIHQVLSAVFDIFHQHGVINIVLCPGSRSAPIAIAATRSNRFSTVTVVDERSAGFIALGLAKSTQRPTIIVTTSGTAALNVHPALAEAFFSEIPLILITADRPAEIIGQGDNQAIYQNGIFAQNIKQSFTLPLTDVSPSAIEHCLRISNEAMLLSISNKKGPIHINVPLREPIYPSIGEVFEPLPSIKFIQKVKTNSQIDNIETLIPKGSRIIVVASGISVNFPLQSILDKHNIVFLKDVTFNEVNNSSDQMNWLSAYLSSHDLENLTPDILISFGGQINCKSLKDWIKKSNIKKHIHISLDENVKDSYGNLTHIIPISITDFIDQLERIHYPIGDAIYYENLQTLSQSIEEKGVLNKSVLLDSEAGVFHKVIEQLNSNSVLHLGNSLIIRYMVEFPYHRDKFLSVFANRGTSGIDGSLSTAVGMAIAQPDVKHYLIIGDLSFMYDNHGLYHIPPNLQIIIINNNGGSIFKHIDGPNKTDILNSYFVASHTSDFENIAKHYHLTYKKLISKGNLEDLILDQDIIIHEIMVDTQYHIKSIRELKSLLIK